MLLRQSTLRGIAEGTITELYRRWKRPRVRAGSNLRTQIGVLRIESVDPVDPDAITDSAARAAGHSGRDELQAELGRHGDGPLYRIAVRLAGPDPRRALRARAELGEDEVAELEAKLGRLGTRTGSWALRLLELIAARPAVRAAELAREVDMDTLRFKGRVRQLKELGLTESLDVGYRLSPRGRAFLERRKRPPAR